MRLFRGSSKVKISFNGTVSATAEGDTYRYDLIKFSKDDVDLKRWKTVNIQFDPEDLSGSLFDVTVDATTIDLGNSLKEMHAKGKGYFDVDQFIFPIRPQPANCPSEKQYCAVKRDRMSQPEPVLIFNDG